jgi:hypothetical protein
VWRGVSAVCVWVLVCVERGECCVCVGVSVCGEG